MSKVYKVSPSKLAQWQVLKQGAFGMTPEKFLMELKAGVKPNEAMSRGTAYHEMIENGIEPYEIMIGGRTYYRVFEKEMGIDWTFAPKAVQPIIDIRKKLASLDQPHINEMWGTYRAKIGHYDVVVKMRLDLVVGRVLHEFKTTGKPPRYDKYIGSIQHRCYQLAFPDLQKTFYHVFHLDELCTDCAYHHFEAVHEPFDYVRARVHGEIFELLTWLENHPSHLATLEYIDEPKGLDSI